MAAIDLIVLGMLKQKPMSAYDLQKLVEYRNISRWVKISTPSIYKKVIQLEEKGLLQARTLREGRMPEKTVYSLTSAGETAFEELMLEISGMPIHLFLDFNAVIVNLDSLPPEKQRLCVDGSGRTSGSSRHIWRRICGKRRRPPGSRRPAWLCCVSSTSWRRPSRAGSFPWTSPEKNDPQRPSSLEKEGR